MFTMTEEDVCELVARTLSGWRVVPGTIAFDELYGQTVRVTDGEVVELLHFDRNGFFGVPKHNQA